MEERYAKVLDGILNKVVHMDRDFESNQWKFAKEKDGCMIHNMVNLFPCSHLTVQHIPSYATLMWRGCIKVPNITVQDVKSIMDRLPDDKEL